MNKKSIYILPSLLVMFMFSVSVWLYNLLPVQIPTHWNIEGGVDGYSSKAFGAFFLPEIALLVFLLLMFFPRIDPLKKNFESFRKYYDYFVFVLIVFFFSLHVLILSAARGYSLPIQYFIVPVTAVLFYVIGLMMKKSKRNWFVGVRTPWTLSSDTVWEKTHQVTGKLFLVWAALCLTGLFFSKMIFWTVIIPAVGIVIFSFVYSYFLYKKEIKR